MKILSAVHVRHSAREHWRAATKKAEYEDTKRRALTWVMTHAILNEDQIKDQDSDYQDTFGGEVMGSRRKGVGHLARFCLRSIDTGKYGGQKASTRRDSSTTYCLWKER